jgi:hypothetical protein
LDFVYFCTEQELNARRNRLVVAGRVAGKEKGLTAY